MLMLPDFRVRQRDFLLEISRAMTAQLEMAEVLRLVLNASVVMLAGQVGLIALRDSSGQYLVRATIGVDAEHIPVLNRQLLESANGSRDTLNLDVLNQALSQMATSLDYRLRQSIALPLTIADEPLGLLIVFRAYWGAASANDMQILQSFADQAAIAVYNAQLYEHIDNERKRLSAIVEYSADGVMILDADLRIHMFNRALERMTGWRASEVLGLHQDDVISWTKLQSTDLAAALGDGWPYHRAPDAPETLYVEGDITRRDGLNLSVGITYAPLFTSEKLLASIIANVRDITNFRKAQEMQSIFISGISHELKTPVTLIKGYAGTLRREDTTWDPRIVRDGLAIIEDEADRLTRLIEDLLVASRLQAEAIQLTLGDVRLDLLAARAVERFSTQTEKHRLICTIPEDFPVVRGDETRLRQVLDNLLNNAIKYSPRGGTIEVGGEILENAVLIYVRDEGVGLTENEQERIFDRFYRVDSALSRKTQGTGLGLYLSKAIIEAHRGKLDVRSQPGKGSTFLFTIPLD